VSDPIDTFQVESRVRSVCGLLAYGVRLSTLLAVAIGRCRRRRRHSLSLLLSSQLLSQLLSLSPLSTRSQLALFRRLINSPELNRYLFDPDPHHHKQFDLFAADSARPLLPLHRYVHASPTGRQRHFSRYNSKHSHVRVRAPSGFKLPIESAPSLFHSSWSELSRSDVRLDTALAFPIAFAALQRCWYASPLPFCTPELSSSRSALSAGPHCPFEVGALIDVIANAQSSQTTCSLVSLESVSFVRLAIDSSAPDRVLQS
jgi:hypothetical protein